MNQKVSKLPTYSLSQLKTLFLMCKSKLNIILFVQFVILSFSLDSNSRSSEKMSLQPTLTAELNRVLKNADGLHSACVNGNADHVTQAIIDVIQSLAKAEKVSPLAKTEHPHLVRILAAARKKLEESRLQPLTMKSHFLKEAFKDLVQISRIYRLEPYNVYFCNQDQSLWLQKSAQPQNPISPDRYANCGRLVR